MSASLSVAEMKAVLEEMVGRVPPTVDGRPQAAIDADMAAEQAAEDMAWMRAHPSASESEYAARKWAG